jgi:chromate transporter
LWQLAGRPTLEETAHVAEEAGRGHLREVVLAMLKLGTVAFGGPAAHLAMMRKTLVESGGWVDEQEFVDLMGAASLLPGPTSTEVSIMLARRRAGRLGLVLGGSAFILPAMVLVLVLTRLYESYGSTGPGEAILHGVLPVVIAIVAAAVVSLGRVAAVGATKSLLAAAGLAGYLLGVYPFFLLLGGALLGLSSGEARRRLGRGSGLLVAAPSLAAIFLEFLKLGAVVFGSGYVLFSYLRADLVRSHHWLSAHKLLAAVAIGQLTPGPVFTTATAIGEMLAGVPGGVVATLGMFLPSFLLVAAFLPVLSRLRERPRGRDVLDGLNAVAVALMAGVTYQLGRTAVVGWLTAIEAVVALVLLVRFRVNATWLILAGALAGVIVWAR